MIDRYGSVWDASGGGKALFDSHTIGAVLDEQEWSHPPFSGDISDGFLWGRGSVDMKSGLAASIYAAAVARSRGTLAGKTVYVSATVDEEYCDGESLKHLLVDEGIRPDFTVICEPSANVITTGHKGKAR